MLFTGPAGTGKTLAAEAIARELNVVVQRVDVPAIVSKFIGETEKNLDAVFSSAATVNAVLFFDEADALLGKRSKVKDAHDRYANIEVDYLLKRIEAYPGLVILASNLPLDIDPSVLKRMALVVDFPTAKDQNTTTR